jgi:hypothetical protein
VVSEPILGLSQVEKLLRLREASITVGPGHTANLGFEEVGVLVMGYIIFSIAFRSL